MKIHFAVLPLLLAALASAQGDTVVLASGTVVEGASVQSFNIRELKYSKAGRSETVSTDAVASVDLAKFRDVYRRAIAARDADVMTDEARAQLKKDALLAQFGYIEAAKLYFENDKDGTAGSVLDELKEKIPDAGLLPEVFRMKFDAYMGRGDAAGYQNAATLAQKYTNEAATGAWPTGFAIEADMFAALAAGAAGGDAKAFQNKMRDVAGRAAPVSPMLAARANVQLAHSLRATGDAEGAKKLYQQVLENATDDGSRAGAYLGLGLLAMSQGDAANRDPYREALLSFLRVRIETKGAGAGLQAEALYQAMLAAEKWGGQDWRTAAGRCRYLLTNNFPNSEWAARARGQ